MENAIGHYKAALKGGFVEGEILNKLGICYLNSGQQGGFLTLMEKYKYNPRVDAVRYEDCLFVGHGYVLLGRLDEALTWYEKASRINPKDGYVHYKLGKIRLAQGEIQKAVGHFQEALQIDADFADAHYQRGVCYERLGQERPAAEEYGRAVHILPGHLEGTKALRSLGVFQADSIGTPMLRVDHDLGGYITLLGIDLSASEVILEQSFYITFYWKLSRDFFTASNDGREEDRFSVKIFVRDGDLSFWLTDRNPWYQPAPEDWKIGEVIKQKERFTISVQPMGLRKMGKKLDESTFKRYRIPTHTPCEVQVNLRKEENKKAELYICRIPTDLYIQ